MKLIILSQSNPHFLVSQLNEQGHVVMAITSDFEMAVPVIFEHRPHTVVVCGNADNPFVQQAGRFISGLPDLRLVLHQETDTGDLLRRQLDEIRRQVAHHKQSPVADQRLIFFDARYTNLLHGAKLRSGKPGHEALIQEQDKFLLLLEQATARQEVARRYYGELKQGTNDEWREISYRLMHGSCKAVAYGQEQLGRCLSVLAHYVPNIDPCYLATPGDAVRGVRWVFYGSSPETIYAFSCLSQVGFIQGLHTPIKSLLSHCFKPEEDGVTTHVALALLGCCGVLEQVVEAHLSAMARSLSGQTEKLVIDLHKRKIRREHQTGRHPFDRQNCVGSVVDFASAEIAHFEATCARVAVVTVRPPHLSDSRHLFSYR